MSPTVMMDDAADAIARAGSYLEYATRCSDQAGRLAGQLSGGLDVWVCSLRQVCCQPRISAGEWATTVGAAGRHRAAVGELRLLVSEALRAVNCAATCLLAIGAPEPSCPGLAGAVATVSVAVIRLDAVLRFADPVIDQITGSLIDARHACECHNPARISGSLLVLDEHSRELSALARIIEVTVRPTRGPRTGTAPGLAVTKESLDPQPGTAALPVLRREQRSEL